MVATGGVGSAFPVSSSLETVKARNKFSGVPQLERRPMDIRAQRLNRKRKHQLSRQNLDKVQTPLVEAHRPSKKRISEASRHHKNYEIAAKKSRVPKNIHTSVLKIIENKNLN